MPGASAPAPSTGFSVDTSDRVDVLSFWHAVYMASEGFEDRIGWTGHYSILPGAEGTTSAAFVDDVERRVNYFRAMCGVQGSIAFNDGAAVVIQNSDAFQPASSTLRSAAAQRGALMMALSQTITHTPSPGLSGWTAAAWNGCNKGALAYGLFGPAAVDAYFRENIAGTSSWNNSVGHRRWLLNVNSTRMATGDMPGDGTALIAPTNVLYVFPGSDELASDPSRFVSYPAPGFFPARVNSPFWSLSHDDANFSSATVTMTGPDGANVPVSVVARNATYAAPAIVWSVPESVYDDSPGADRTYTVTVSGIGGGVAATHTWTTTLIDPDQLGLALPISGVASLKTGESGEFTVPVLAGADRVEVGAFAVLEADWMEGAEDATHVINHTGPNYSLMEGLDQRTPVYDDPFYSEGDTAFHLSFPTTYDPAVGGVPEQDFEIDREILTGSGSKLRFDFRRGYMSKVSYLAVEASTDGGVTWETLGAPLQGNFDGDVDPGFAEIERSLPVADVPVRIRFRFYFQTSGLPATDGIYTEDYAPLDGYALGAFIDRIHCVGADWLEPGTVSTADAAGKVAWTAPLDGAGSHWQLRARAVAGGHEFPWQDPKDVTILGPFGIFGSSAPPVAGATLGFLTDEAADSYRVEVSILGGAWSEGAEDAPVPQVIDHSDASYDLRSSRAGYFQTGARAFRLQVPADASDDDFEIDRMSVPSSGATLSFWRRRGSSKNQQLHAEVKIDGASTWASIWQEDGINFGSDASGQTQVVDLSAYAGQRILIRFRITGVGSTANPGANTGFWIDDIAVTQTRELEVLNSVVLPDLSGYFRFDSSLLGAAPVAGKTYRLAVFPSSGGIEGSPGADFEITPTPTPLANFSGWIEYGFPGWIGGFDSPMTLGGVPAGLIYALGLAADETRISGDALSVTENTATLFRPLEVMQPGISYGAEFSTDLSNWSSEGVTVIHANGILQASAPLVEGGGYLRWKIIEE
ncbi:hypothetical protein [Haloferula sargassicola]|uniref:SCP domain-containing protein n=1 Tax=Haloferula sargassicola TaxID=490096 RepID=A0ABP9UNL1_9BACT